VSAYAYSPDSYLVSTIRQLEAWTRDQLQLDPALADVFELEMSFPDTTRITKASPLEKLLIHFELDEQANPTLGFGKPGVSVYDEDLGVEVFSEAALHLLNFDVGIWASAEAGGASKRMEARQALTNLFATVTGKELFNADTEGLWIVSFDGGRDLLDRVNDLPIWRSASMTLVVRVFSRHTPPVGIATPDEYFQDPELTIIGDDGLPDPVETP
jgi:hypothetical protein